MSVSSAWSGPAATRGRAASSRFMASIHRNAERARKLSVAVATAVDGGSRLAIARYYRSACRAERPNLHGGDVYETSAYGSLCRMLAREPYPAGVRISRGCPPASTGNPPGALGPQIMFRAD